MTYAELKQAMLDNSKRSDLTSRFPLFIGLAHNRLMSVLDAPDTLSFAQVDPSGAVNLFLRVWTVPLPTDTLEVRYVYVNGRAVPSFSQEALVSELGRQGATGFARGYAVDGLDLMLAPGVGDQLHVSYKKYLPMFADDTDTNWLLTNYPDLYLYGALVHLNESYQNFEQVATSQQLYDATLIAAGSQIETLKAGGTPRIRSS